MSKLNQSVHAFLIRTVTITICRTVKRSSLLTSVVRVKTVLYSILQSFLKCKIATHILFPSTFAITKYISLKISTWIKALGFHSCVNYIELINYVYIGFRRHLRKLTVLILYSSWWYSCPLAGYNLHKQTNRQRTETRFTSQNQRTLSRPKKIVCYINIVSINF